jgi:biotin carboxyl carrier protein
MGKSLGKNASLKEIQMKYITTVNDEVFEIELLKDNKVIINGEEILIDFETVPGQMVHSLIVNGKSYEARINEDDDNWSIYLKGTLYSAEVIDEREKRLRDASSDDAGTGNSYSLKSPMPGLIVKVPFSAGDSVEVGDVLAILESMKMQNELKSPIAGIVSEVAVSEGENVEKKQILLNVNPPEKE